MIAKSLLIIRWFLLIIALATAMAAFYYREQYVSVRQRLSQQQALVTDMQQRIKGAVALDENYLHKLKLAETTISQLKHDVSVGKQRLQLAARCSAVATTGTTGVDDAKRPRLTDAAQWDYFTLRERIETTRLQIAGLQDYILQQCLR